MKFFRGLPWSHGMLKKRSTEKFNRRTKKKKNKQRRLSGRRGVTSAIRSPENRTTRKIKDTIRTTARVVFRSERFFTDVRRKFPQKKKKKKTKTKNPQLATKSFSRLAGDSHVYVSTSALREERCPNRRPASIARRRQNGN